MSDLWWQSVSGRNLAQGDLLPNCLLPVFVAPTASQSSDDSQEVSVLTARLIVVTQSCDLENKKVQFGALCPIHTLSEDKELGGSSKGASASSPHDRFA